MNDITDEAELIDVAKDMGEFFADGSTLSALEAFYMNGVADDVSGDVEAITGHFYRVGRWIVVTDVQGFKSVTTYASVDEAILAFTALDIEYGENTTP